VSLRRPPPRCASLSPHTTSLASPLRLHADEKPPRRRSSSGYRGVHAWPNVTFYAEICSGDKRTRLGTFETAHEAAHEAAHAYDAVTWRLGRSRRSMNFNDVWTRQQAEELTPPAGTCEERQRQRKLEQRLVIAERDERLRLEWARQFPEDVTAMEVFYDKKEDEKAVAKAAKKAAKKADREERRAKAATRKSEREEKATRKAEEKKNCAGPSTIVLSSSSSSSSFEWTSTPVSSTIPGSSDIDWDSEKLLG
jgi:hypothetical protein